MKVSQPGKDTWVKIFTEGLLPILSDQEKQSLRHSLTIRDPRFMQGATTFPMISRHGAYQTTCERGCLIGVIGMNKGLTTVGEVEDYFAHICHLVDVRMGEASIVRHLLNFYDQNDLDEVCDRLLQLLN